METIRNGSVGAPLSPEQDELLWDMMNGIYDGYRGKTLSGPQIFQMAQAWRGTTNFLATVTVVSVNPTKSNVSSARHSPTPPTVPVCGAWRKPRSTDSRSSLLTPRERYMGACVSSSLAFTSGGISIGLIVLSAPTRQQTDVIEPRATVVPCRVRVKA